VTLQLDFVSVVVLEVLVAACALAPVGKGERNNKSLGISYRADNGMFEMLSLHSPVGARRFSGEGSKTSRKFEDVWIDNSTVKYYLLTAVMRF
jgi:hypothetical protein